MSEKTKQNISLSVMFSSAIFLQLCILSTANHAGEGYLPVDQREYVYYALQIFVLFGFFAYAAMRAAVKDERAGKGITAFVLCVFFAGAAVMLFSESSGSYIIVTYATMLCLGFWCGALYERMSVLAASKAEVAKIMGIGYGAAVALQFLLQLQWGTTPFLTPVMLLAFVFTALMLLKTPKNAKISSQNTGVQKISKKHILFSCIIAAALLLFANFYNGYIHHLQIVSGYTDFNVYTWPRLILIPCYLFFALIGDRGNGRIVQVAALCIALAALLNSVLTSNADAYRLNMCLFYCGIAGAVSYYNLTFWRLAQRTKHPALWASMGRVIDSAIVLIGGAVHLSSLPDFAVLSVDIAMLALIIILMAFGGGKRMSAEALTEPSLSSSGAVALNNMPQDVFDLIKERYTLTQRETDVFRELVLTEDKQTVIGERLSIRPRTVQLYVTALYQKTGASTRAGLTDIYHETMSGR